MILDIAEHIHAVLQGTSAITTKVGTRTFPIATIEEVAFPLIVFERTSITPIYSKERMIGSDVYCTIFVAADTYAESVDIANAVITALDRKAASYTGYTVKDAVVTGASEAYQNDAFIQDINFKFTILNN